MIQTLQEKTGEDETDADGNVIKKAEVQEYKVTQLKLDSNGNRILTKPSALKQYGIKVLQFEIQNVKLDEKAQKQLDIVKEREMQRVANATAATCKSQGYALDISCSPMHYARSFNHAKQQKAKRNGRKTK